MPSRETASSESSGGRGKMRYAMSFQRRFVVMSQFRSPCSTPQLRVIWNLQVGVDIWMRGAPRLPRNFLALDINPIDSAVTQTQLPFFKPKHLLAEKIRCAGERKKDVDGDDLLWIMSGPPPTFPPIDPVQVRKLLSDDELSKALQNHPGNVVIQTIMASC